jgi:peptidoglycan/LPS O-acetylase OafA/YrhL
MTTATPRRNYAYDNLRTLMVLLIVLLHAACAYATGIPWWHAQDAKALPFDITIITIDNFALPVLFFIAGLFAHATRERYGNAGFIRSKLKRLGIPLLVIPSLYLPAMVYVGYLRRTENPAGFFEYWLRWMASLQDWGFVVITNMEQGALYSDLFSPHHLWFLSLLLLFFIGYACCRADLFSRFEAGMGKTTLIAALSIALGFTGLNLLTQDWAWARFGPFILFQPTRIPVYLGMFLFGVLASPHMDRLRPFPGPWWLWLIGFLAAQAVMLPMVSVFMMTPGPAPLGLALLHGALRTTLAVTAAGFLVNFGTARLAGPSRWSRSLAASSYDIYIWHMPMAVFVQAGLASIPMPLAAKAALAFLVPVLLFWFLSRRAARFQPCQWAGFLLLVFAGFGLATL